MTIHVCSNCNDTFDCGVSDCGYDYDYAGFFCSFECREEFYR